MPVYEYRCTQCQKVFEYQHRMADPAKTTCEECSGALERLISRSSFALKGDGWYKDLYSSAKPATPAATPTESNPAESKPVEAKPAEAKPAEAKPATPKPSTGGGGTPAAS